MMKDLDNGSKVHLITCEDVLATLCYRALLITNFTVLSGWRSEDEQNELYRQGKSKHKFGQSKHNLLKSKAISLAPLPIDYNDKVSFAKLAGIFEALAFDEDVRLRWGGDPGGCGDITEFELM